MKVVGIDFNPGPDAQERLCRLFIILLKLPDDELPLSGPGSRQDDGHEEDARFASSTLRCFLCS